MRLTVLAVYTLMVRNWAGKLGEARSQWAHVASSGVGGMRESMRNHRKIMCGGQKWDRCAFLESWTPALVMWRTTPPWSRGGTWRLASHLPAMVLLAVVLETGEALPWRIQ